MICGYDSQNSIGDTDDIVKIEYTSKRNNVNAVQYRVLNNDEKHNNVLEIANGNIKCIHNIDFSDVIFVYKPDDLDSYFYNVEIEGLDENDISGFYKFINSNNTKLENYSYVEGDEGKLVGKICTSNFEKIDEYKSEYGTCYIIRQEINRYAYRAKFENDQKREKSANEQEFITDQYTYYYTENEKIQSYVQYILYVEHPIELVNSEYYIEKGESKKSITKVMSDGIKINTMNKSTNNVSDWEVVELYKKMIPEKK